MKKISKVLSMLLVILILVPTIAQASSGGTQEEKARQVEKNQEEEKIEELLKELKEEKEAAKVGGNSTKLRDTEEQTLEEELKDNATEKMVLNERGTEDPDIERIQGKNRIETSIKLSQKTYKSVKTVFLAGYEGEADALTATFVAGQLDSPLLLTYKDKVDNGLLDELRRLKPQEVIILGGESAVRKNVEEVLIAKGFNTKRIKGKNRIETATNVVLDYYSTYKKKALIDEIFVVEYNSLVDALSIGSVSARDGIPVLIVKKDEVPKEVTSFIKSKGVKRATIIGGKQTVSEKGEADLKKHLSKVSRIAGSSRSATSIEICSTYFKPADNTVVANGYKYADALIGGYFAAKKNAPILLAGADSISADTLKCIEDENVKPYVLGGEYVINADVFNAISSIAPRKAQPIPDPKAPMVCLDYGHGGSDSGASYQGRYEKNDTIYMGRLVAAELRRHKVIVDETRTSDKYVSLEDRVKFANKKNYNYFVSFHRNAFAPEKASGVEVWTSNPSSPLSTKLAQAIQDNLVKVGFIDRKVKAKNFYVVRYTKAPAALIELGFIDNSKDNDLHDRKEAEIVIAVARAILGELGIKYKY